MTLGKLDGREHGTLAAQVTAFGIEDGDVTVANEVLRQAPSCLLSRHDFERKPSLPASSQQGCMIGVVVICDGHHASDLEKIGPAGRFQLRATDRWPAAGGACSARLRHTPCGTPAIRLRMRRTAPGS